MYGEGKFARSTLRQEDSSAGQPLSSSGMFRLAATTTRFRRYACSHRSCNSEAKVAWQARLRLISRNPCSTARRKPASRAAAVPLQSPRSTRMSKIRALGAMAEMIPATPVPWPNASLFLPGRHRTGFSTPPRATTFQAPATRRRKSGCEASTPLSTTATFTRARRRS